MAKKSKFGRLGEYCKCGGKKIWLDNRRCPVADKPDVDLERARRVTDGYCDDRLTEAVAAEFRAVRLDEVEDMPHDSACKAMRPEELENFGNCTCYRGERIAELEAK